MTKNNLNEAPKECIHCSHLYKYGQNEETQWGCNRYNIYFDTVTVQYISSCIEAKEDLECLEDTKIWNRG